MVLIISLYLISRLISLVVWVELLRMIVQVWLCFRARVRGGIALVTSIVGITLF